MIYVGISKATFTVAYLSKRAKKTGIFKNTAKGIHEFIRAISPEGYHRVLETNGIIVLYSFICFRKLVLLSLWRIH